MSQVTVWTMNGLSDRVVKAGDGVRAGEVKAGAPIPIFFPHVHPDEWTLVSPV